MDFKKSINFFRKKTASTKQKTADSIFGYNLFFKWN